MNAPQTNAQAPADVKADERRCHCCGEPFARCRETYRGTSSPAGVLSVINLPIGNGFEHKSAPRAFTGLTVGPFFVHQGISDNGTLALDDDDFDLWHVTHLKSGYAAQKGIPNLARGIWLARQLCKFDFWDADTKEGVREQINDDLLAEILVLRADAINGDCQGEFAAFALDGKEPSNRIPVNQIDEE